MKRQALTLVGVLSLLLAAGSAYAQTIGVRADVPFDFIVNKQTLPPGQYTLQTQGADRILLVRGADMKPMAIVITNRVQSVKPSHQTKLVFLRYGDRYFLSEIWAAGNDSGHQLRKSAREAEMARDSKPQETIVAALLK